MAALNPTEPMAPWLEQAWLERYFGRELADDERAWFETYLLDKPHLLDRWETELALRDGLDLAERHASAASAPPNASVATLPTTAATGHVRPARRRVWRMPAALAASITMAFGAGFLLNGVRPNRGDTLIADPTRMVVDVSRGSAPAPSVENEASKSEFILIDALVPPDATSVVVRGPGLPGRTLAVSKDGVATLLLRRSEIERIGPLTIVIQAGGREFERPLPIGQHSTGRTP